MVEATAANLIAECFGRGSPSPQLVVGFAALFIDPDRSVQGNPGHELGVDVMPGRVATFPYAGVGLSPGSGDMVGEGAHGPPGLIVETAARIGELPGAVEDPPVTVQLVLGSGSVSDTHRCALGVSGPALQVPLAGYRAAVESEQRGKPRAVKTAGVQEPSEESEGLLVSPG